MSRARQELAALRAARDAARQDLAVKLGAAQALATPLGFARRLRDRLMARSQRAMGALYDIAGDHRGLVAGAVSAMMLWIVRSQVHARLGGWLKTKGPVGRVTAVLLGVLLRQL